MAAIYDVMELATAVKPTLVRHLLVEGGEPVAYLDPDILVFLPLDGIERLAREHDIVLTPHTSVPLPDDGFARRGRDHGGRRVSTSASSPSARAPCRSWTGGPSGCRADAWWPPSSSCSSNQRWIDLVPCYFRHFVLRDPG